MKKLATFPAFFNITFFDSIEKTSVALSKAFKDKRQRKNFLTFVLSLIIQGSPLLSLVPQITQTVKNWQACLSLFLSSEAWSFELVERIRQRFSKTFIKKLRFVILDITALVKTGKCFEHLCSVYDGRDGKIKPGYSLLSSMGLSRDVDVKIPLLCKLISYHHQFRSQNLEITKLLSELEKWLKNQLKNVIFLADRGFDNKYIISWFLPRDYLFLIRANRKKKVKLANGEICLLSTLAEGIYRKVKVLAWGLNLQVIVKKDGDEKFIFLVHPNLEIQSLNQAQQLYLKRWEIDNLFKELKQNYGLEKFRVRKFEAIKKVLSLTFLAYQVVQVVNLRYQKLIKKISSIIFQVNQYFQVSIYSLRNLAQKVSFFGLTAQIMARLTEIRANSP